MVTMPMMLRHLSQGEGHSLLKEIQDIHHLANREYSVENIQDIHHLASGLPY